MLKSQFSNLSDEILYKKTNALNNQFKELVDFILIYDNDITVSQININTNINREELEKTCSYLMTTISLLKNTQKKIIENNKKIVVEEEEEIFIDKKQKFDTIIDLYNLKVSLLNLHIEEFNKILDDNNFIYYKGIYKYNDEINDIQDYVIRNRNKSFVKRFEDYTKNIFGCFKIIKYDKYESICYFLLNGNSDFETFLLNEYDDFTMIKTTKNEFIDNMEKKEDFDMIYIH